MRFVTLNQPCYTTYDLRVTMSSRVTNFHVTLPTLQQLINAIKTSQLQHLVMCILYIYTKYKSSYSVPKLRYGPLALNIETLTTRKKSLKHDNINNMCYYLK